MVRYLIVFLALGSGVVAGWLALTLPGGSEAGQAARPEPTTRDVLVAAVDLSHGAEVGPGRLEWRPWPESAIRDDLISRDARPDAIGAFDGWVTRAETFAGEPVRAGRLANAEAGLMALILAPGMRAAAVRVSAEHGAGGFILPNDHVDVVHTLVANRGGASRTLSRTILTNVRVLAIDQQASQADEKNARVGDTATLELSPEQVEILTVARGMGQVALVLRSVADFGESGIGDIALIMPAEEATDEVPRNLEVAAVGPPRPARRVEVRLIQSGQASTVNLADIGPRAE